MLHINQTLTPHDFTAEFPRFWKLSGAKIQAIEQSAGALTGAPVFTRNGVYTSQGWTDWTQGFQFGSAILQFDATGDPVFLESGREKTIACMAPHVTHCGVHDHGFNNISTYGNLRRLMGEGRIAENRWERACYELALKCSGAVQARRWTTLKSSEGFIYSFNGPHSLFIDTVRTLRSLAVAHHLRHVLKDENDRAVSLLERLLTHLKTTAAYNIYYGENRDAYDIRGRVAHEAIFNVNDGNYRCPNSQQGYSPFTTWTRGLAWAMLGFAEELEFLSSALLQESFVPRTSSSGLEKEASIGEYAAWETIFLKAARATCDFYLANTPTDGVPYWDTGAPGLAQMEGYLERPSDPFNAYEPVDSSAAAIAAQGLLRLGHYLQERGEPEQGQTYWQAGLTVLKTLLDEPYLSTNPKHQGLILHAVYHRPRGWDYLPDGATVPSGEATLWGDYHAREVVLYVQRIMRNEPYYTFWGE